MPYGIPLKSQAIYRKMFRKINNKLSKLIGASIPIEHVGGTSLRKLIGKGDIDVYILGFSQRERKLISKKLQVFSVNPPK